MPEQAQEAGHFFKVKKENPFYQDEAERRALFLKMPLPTFRRSIISTILDVLEILEKEELVRTHIMGRANLNYKMAKSLLDSLESLGLIEKIDADERLRGELHAGNAVGVYRITQKGKDTLEIGRELERKLGLQGDK